MVQLNIVKNTTADITRTLLRCRQDVSQGLGEALDTPGVLAVTASDLRGVRDANCAFAPENVSAEQIDAVNNAFIRHGTRCLQWISPTASEILSARSTTARSLAVLRLSRWLRSDASPPVMVLQARAAVAQTHDLLNQIYSNDAAHVLAGERHLDDAKFELLLALDGGRVVGCVGLLVSGDAAFITHHYISPTHRDCGVGRLLIDRAIDFAARATLRHVLMNVDETDAALTRFYAGVGFDRAGTIVEYDFA